ncbi:MAG: TonB-dependent receptor [Acidobacteria bacterium]|nr:TonB-dependent receptor [Acidobacteriota bacterium]
MRFFNMKLATWYVIILLTGFCLPVAGQATRGSLSGQVNDAAGAAVAGASVIVKNNATGEEFRQATDAQGAFAFLSLPIGRYNATVEAQGFKRSELREIIIEVATPAKVNLALEVGSVSETVSVSSEAQEVINTTSPTLNAVVTTRQVEDLPLPTRAPLDLIRLQAGIAMISNNIRSANPVGLRESAVNLTQDGVNVKDNFLNSEGFFAISNPNVEATSEFSVSTGTNDSGVGRGVVQVRIVTKSGTNELHGALSWFHRNDNLNANTFFNNATRTERPIQLQNRFGFNVGGPILLPKKLFGPAEYDGRSRSFWFVAYEGFREPRSVTNARTVLTADARRGVFRYVDATRVTRSVNLLEIGNPGATQINPLTASEINQTPLPNDLSGLVGDGLNTAGYRFNSKGKDTENTWGFRFDQHLFNRARLGSHKLEYVLHYAKFFSRPDFTNAGQAPFPGGVDRVQGSTRITTAAAIHSTFGAVATNEVRMGHQRAPVDFLRASPSTNPFFINFGSFTDPTIRFQDAGRNVTVYHFQDNFSLARSGHTIRMGMELQSNTFSSFDFTGTTQTVNLGSNPANNDGIVTTDFTGLPGGAEGSAIVNRARAIYADLTGFLGTATRTFNVANPSSGFAPGASFNEAIRQRDWSLYAQDQWRARRNLTLSYGLRWEFIGPPQSLNGLTLQPAIGVDGLFGISGPGNLFNPGVVKGSAPTLLDLAGEDKGRPFYNNDWNNFAPFFGLAWSPRFERGPLKWLFGAEEGKSSIRGGYSISYLRDGLSVASSAISANPGFTLTPANTNPTGVLGAGGVPIQTPTFSPPFSDAANFAQTQGASGLITFDPNLRTPYVQQWSFGIEREIAHQTALEVRYVGNHAVKLWRTFDVNEVNIFENGFLQEFLNAQNNLQINLGRGQASFAPGAPGTVPLPIFATLFGGTTGSLYASSTFINNLQQGSVGAMANTLATNVAFAATRPRLTINGQPATNFFRANPNAAFARVLSNPAFSNYNALQVEARRRFSRGFSLQGNYTWSKAMTDSEGGANVRESYRTLRNISLDRHRAEYDQTHRFIGNFIVELPFGPGRKFWNGGPAFVRKALEGWQAQGIVNWQTGVPITIVSNRSTFNNLNPALNPAVLVGMSLDELRENTGIYRTPQGVFFFNPALLNITTDPATGQINRVTFKDGLFESAKPGQLGTFERSGINSPNFSQTDFSMIKRTRLFESMNMEFRAEFFNVFNQVNFAYNADIAFDDASAGRIAGTRGARVIQLAMRIKF